MAKKVLIFGKKIVTNLLKDLDKIRTDYKEPFEYILISQETIPSQKVESYQRYGIQTMVVKGLSDKNVLKSVVDPIYRDILTILCFSELYLPFIQKINELYPQLANTSPESLEKSLHKGLMKQAFLDIDPNITSKSVTINILDNVSEVIQKSAIEFPIVVKPSGLFSSLLVTKCNNQKELKNVLLTIRKKYSEIVLKKSIVSAQDIIIEEFVEGKMYSIDVYIDNDLKIYECPLVGILTGYHFGIPDFCNIQRITPIDDAEVTKKQRKELSHVIQKGIQALDLRNTSAHIEVILSPTGWKIIEIGARVGGFRAQMYELAFGINHIRNDFLIHLKQKPHVPKQCKKNVAVLRLYHKEEGTLKKILNLDTVMNLSSYVFHKQLLEVGEQIMFSYNGGGGYAYVILANNDRKQLKNDIVTIYETITCILTT